MPPAAQVRLPYSALAGFVGDVQKRVLGQRIGVPPRTLDRWALIGIPIERADTVAIALGVHPCAIWTDWWDR